MATLSNVNAFIEIDYGDHIVRYKINKINDINLRVWALKDSDIGFAEKMTMGFDLAFGGCVGKRFLIKKDKKVLTPKPSAPEPQDTYKG